MPELAPVGRTDQPTPEELEPVVLPVAARTPEGEEIVEKFSFRPVMPPIVESRLEQFSDGNIPVTVALQCLNTLTISDEEQARWIQFHQRQDVLIESSVVAEMLVALVEYYGSRPTRPSSGSSRTRRRSGKTSTAAASSKDSGSKP